LPLLRPGHQAGFADREGPEGASGNTDPHLDPRRVSPIRDQEGTDLGGEFPSGLIRNTPSSPMSHPYYSSKMVASPTRLPNGISPKRKAGRSANGIQSGGGQKMV